MSEPDRLDQFLAALDALYARQEVLTARLDYLTEASRPAERSSEEREEIENIQREYGRLMNGSLISKSG